MVSRFVRLRPRGVRSSLLGAAVTLFGVSTGCRPEQEISQYDVPKPSSIQLPSDKQATAAGDQAAAGERRPERMLGAMVPYGQQMWFFKLNGAPDAVAARADEFRQLITSVHLAGTGDKARPEWTLPSGWKESPASGMRLATLTTSDTPPLEVSVIGLPAGGTSVPEQVLANVNRWRGQLNLDPIPLDQLADQSTSEKTNDGAVATIVDYVGTATANSMMNAPFARGMGMGGAPPLGVTAATSPATPAIAPKSLTAEKPDGWTEGRVGGMRKAAFEVTAGDQKAEITVIDLPEGAGDRLANINRWRGQIGLEPVEAKTMTTETVPVGPLKGDFVELLGDPNAARPQAILGVIVDHGGQTWFVKLQGDRDLAVAQKDNFLAYAASLRLP